MFSGTDRAAAAGHPGFDLCPPAMSFFAPPPDKSVASCGELRRLSWRVLPYIPLGGKRRIQRHEVVALSHFCASTIGTAGASGAAVNGSLPGMSPAAAPPQLPFAAVRDGLRCQRRVLLCVPFVQQVRFSVLPAKRVQCLSDSAHLPAAFSPFVSVWGYRL